MPAPYVAVQMPTVLANNYYTSMDLMVLNVLSGAASANSTQASIGHGSAP